MPPILPRHSSAAFSDQGFVRSNNEDRVYCDDERGFFLVVDGVGGHEAGEQAAAIAVERIRVRLERQTDSVERRLREAITLANNAVYESAVENPEWKGMACVLTAAVIEEGQVTVGHVGDSRLYRIERGAIEKMTHDHSPVGEREDSGDLTETEAMKHPRRNEVYRDVGSEEHSPDDESFIEVLTFPFDREGAILLCSDGLSDALPSENILRIIEQNAGDKRAAVQALISAANQIGSDNVSAILVEGDRFAAWFEKRSSGGLPAIAGERTDRLAVRAAAPLPWYRGTTIHLFCGLLLGAAAAFAVLVLASPEQFRWKSRVLMVTPSGTISDAVRGARPGDTILVSPGVYNESVQLKQGVTVLAERANKAVIQGPVTADNVKEARLEGFQIRGGEAGIRIKDSDVTLARNDVAESSSAGVEFSGTSGGVIFGCNIHNNTGPGIILSDAAAPAVENNVIVQNGVAPNSLRPGLLVRSSSPQVIAGNIFARNGAEPVWLPAPDEDVIQRNSFALSGDRVEGSKVRLIPLKEERR